MKLFFISITFQLPEYHTAGHEIHVAVGASGCPVGTCPSCPTLLRVESNPTVDQSTFSYKPPKVTLIQIKSFPNATTDADGKVDKMLILEGENFCSDDDVCGSVWLGDLVDDAWKLRYPPTIKQGSLSLVQKDQPSTNRTIIRNGREVKIKAACPQYPRLTDICQYSHNKIVLVTNADTGTVWVTAGMQGTSGALAMVPQETNVAERPPKQFRFVSPEISKASQNDLNVLIFDTSGGCEISLTGKYFGSVESNLCVTVGNCIPRPVCGQPCMEHSDGTGDIVGQSVIVSPGTLEEKENNMGTVSFVVPPFQGSFNDLFVWRGDQASINNFVSGSNKVREYTLTYKRVGEKVTDVSSCANPNAVRPPANSVPMPPGGCISLVNSCPKETTSGTVCVTPSCYSKTQPIIRSVDTGLVIDIIPTSGVYVNIESTQLGYEDGIQAPRNSRILFGAFYKELEGKGCIEKGCDWFLSINENKPKCGCDYSNLRPESPDLWSSVDPDSKSKTWTNEKISNVWIPPGTGKGYKLQVVVNGMPSQPVELNYANPTVNSVTDSNGGSMPAKGGTIGGMILTIKGNNFGCTPTVNTIDPNGEIPDGLLTPTELLKIYDGNLRDVDDILAVYDDTYDETILYPTDLNKQRKMRIEAAHGVNRNKFADWQDADGPFTVTNDRWNLCQGPPVINLRHGDEDYNCPVLTLTNNELTCNATAGEGQDLDVSLVPAGFLWEIDFVGEASPKSLIESQEIIKEKSYTYNIPEIFAIETTIPDIDCISVFGHACGPSSAIIRIPIPGKAVNGSSSNSGRRRLNENDDSPSMNGTMTKPVLLTIKGSNFGRIGGNTVEVKMLCTDGAKYCTDQELTLDASSIVRTQNKIVIKLSPGIGENLAVKVTVAGQSNVFTQTGKFTFMSPKITAVYPDFGSTLKYVTLQDRQDGKFFHRRFEQGDVSPTDGVLSLQELRALLKNSKPLREIVDLTARDADFTFDALDSDRNKNLTMNEFVSISYAPTDGCETGSFESLVQWQDRVTQATKAERDANPKQFERMCLKPRTMIYFGENLGPLQANEIIPTRMRMWVGSCGSFVSVESCGAMERCTWDSTADVSCTVVDMNFQGAFDIYDKRTQLADSKCSELSSYDNEEQGWMVTCSPIGLGINHELFVSLSGRETVSNFRWNFAKPSISSSQPRPYSANGEVIVIRGENLGGVFSPAEVNISDIECLDAQWFPAYETDGRPYVACRTQRDVVGSKSVAMKVAMQYSAAVNSFRNVLNVTQQLSRFHSVCKAGETNLETGNERIFYGSPGQLCSLCPVGTICKRETYLQPVSIGGFWMDLLDITEGDATVVERTEPLLPEDRMSKRSLDDMKRAIGESNGNADVRRPACAPERMLRIFSNDAVEGSGIVPINPSSVTREDQVKQRFLAEEMYTKVGTGILSVTQSLELARNLAQGYPHAIRDDRCPNVVGCQPKEACNSSNTCNPAYLGEKLRCDEWQLKPENENMRACNLTIQCMARQGGERCMSAIPEICNCPPEWEAGSFACSKKCIREKSQELVQVGCNVKTLSEGISRIPPEYMQFMNGAVCQRQLNATSDISVGVCACVSAPRCTACTRGSHFRQGGECVPCPEQKELIVIMAILGLIFVVIGMRELDKRKFNLAFVSIGWDYFQVLALFADADIRWPPIMKTLFRMLSFFNINIDVVAPECLLPTMKYSDKYFFTMALPIVIAFVLFLSWLFNIFWDKCINQRSVSSGAAKIMAAKLTSTFLLGMYFMYLMITQRALEIFNCNPVEPDDGFTYTQFTSISCDGGLCRCWDPNHVQLFLVPFSIVALFIITLGFPIFLFVLLRAKKNAIKEDQYLRALDIEPSMSTSPNAFFNRLKYHKMYYHFKPGKVYWITFIIARKGLVSTAGLLFRANPGFQLAFVLLVLFWAYVVQVKNNPFMSSVERKTVILEHRAKVKLGDMTHVHLAARIQTAEKEQSKMRSKASRKKLVARTSFSTMMSDITTRSRQDQKMKLNYFWNYNTVERVLLSCLIIVCVCGVMFESDRFQENDARPAGNGFGAWVQFQREFVTFMCIGVIFGSMFFYFCVAYSEIFGKLPVWMRKCLCIKNEVDIHADTDISQRDSQIGMTFSQNPAMLAERDRIASEKATAGLRMQMEEQGLASAAAVTIAKKQAARAIAKAEKGGKGKRRGKKKGKKGFGSKMTNKIKNSLSKNSDDQDENKTQLELQPLASSKEIETMENPLRRKPLSKHKKTNSYVAHDADDGSGNVYYESVDNGETTWTLPAEGKIIVDEVNDVEKASEIKGAQTKVNTRKQHKKTKSFFAHESGDGSIYYESVEKPGETTWKLPENAVVLDDK